MTSTSGMMLVAVHLYMTFSISLLPSVSFYLPPLVNTLSTISGKSLNNFFKWFPLYLSLFNK